MNPWIYSVRIHKLLTVTDYIANANIDVQRESRGNKRNFTETDFHFRLIVEEQLTCTRHGCTPPNSTSQRSFSRNNAPQVPIVRSTVPENGVTVAVETVRSTGRDDQVLEYTGASTRFQKIPGQEGGGTRSPEKPRETRRFHLRKPARDASPVKHATPKGIQKRKRGLGDDLPVFSEKKILGLRLMARPQIATDQRSSLSDRSRSEDRIENVPSAHRKRPIITPAEKKWREANWKPTQQSGKTEMAENAEANRVGLNPIQKDVTSLQLAAQLQQFAMEQTPEHQTTARAPGTQPGRQPLKRQPRSPPPRRHEGNGDAMETESTRAPETQPYLMALTDKLQGYFHAHDMIACVESDEDSGGEWVTDTYVRYPNLEYGQDQAQPGHKPNPTLSNLKDSGAIGLLVIPDEDEELWESYAQDQNSDNEVDSDEDDENGVFVLLLWDLLMTRV